ncbi:MAG: hypothetical protein HCA25_11740 [Dolichospermum sp. DET50]|nr:hypothetical protein [Dolichospermum sp. DET66]MBS3032924.1 hypothetical protein [Dolichospermum sp. DET67]MBS3038129.1 hypothetical protein [Dolichospermum sp. DET50]QSX70033.1 MAG: hypothetical protein EZY12_10955 [Dolichospermum sp. DET69]
MSNRLKLFRERMAAFEGAANPSEAIESGYYVHAPGKLLVDTISGRIALRPSSSHLLLGGIGSGKTTQLLVACQQINEIEDTHAIYVDVSLYTDISKITSGVLTAIAGLELAKLIEDSEDEHIIQSIDSIRNLANGYTYYYDHNDDYDNYDSDLISRKGIIPKKSEGYGISLELLELVSKLSKAASEKYGNIVFLFDGLDRLDDTKVFMQLVYSDAKAISSVGIGLVLVGSLTAIYGNYRDTVDNSLDYFCYQPFFDVENDLEAYNFFEEIIQTRSSEDFIEKSAIRVLILSSGGVLRDFITLTQASIEETYLSGENQVGQKQVLKAVDDFSRSQLLGVSDKELNILEQVIKTKTFIPRTDEDLRLLVRRLILEYREPKISYAVHPAIKQILEQIPV